jgi:isopentenyl-diphosphate delta-isomerase
MDEEMIDVCTPQGQLTGSQKPKSAVHRDGDWHISVHVWILTPHGELLLQRRAEVKENYPGLWDVSVAGHISAGETAIEAAHREASEEIGIDLGSDRFDFVARIPEAVILHDGLYRDNEIHEIYLVRREIDLGSLQLQAGEVAAVRLIPVHDLARMAAARDDSLVPHWKEYEALIAQLAGTAVNPSR